jgi:hypothetical protein
MNWTWREDHFPEKGQSVRCDYKYRSIEEEGPLKRRYQIKGGVALPTRQSVSDLVRGCLSAKPVISLSTQLLDPEGGHLGKQLSA